MRGGVELTILMPCLNEAETLERCIRKAQKSIEQLGVEGEVLIADNGSTDGSVEIAKKLGARVVPIKEKGYGNALRGGIEAACGKWIIMGDADDSYDFSHLQPFVEKLRSGYELVMGCRLPRGGGTVMPSAMPWKHRWIGNPVLSFLGRLFFKTPVSDFHCGLRAFTKDSYERMQLTTTGMEFASEMVIKAMIRNLKVTEVPITLYKDGRSRPPHLRSWRDGWRHLRFMLLFSPRWLFLVPGVVLTLLGTALTCLLAIRPLQVAARLDFNVGTLAVAAMLIIVGVQTIFTACFTKAYAISQRLFQPDPRFDRWLAWFSLEYGLILGLLFVVAGLIGLIRAYAVWHASGFGDLPYSENLRRVIPSSTALTVGLQLIFASFFMSVLKLKVKGVDTD